MSVHSIAIRGNHINHEAVERCRSEYRLEELALRTDVRDHLGRYQATASSVHDSRSERVALVARTAWLSDGLRYHLYVNVRGVTCESGSACTEGRRKIEDSPNSGAMIRLPENNQGVAYRPTAIYLGDFDRNGQPDLMVVLSNGAGLVFEQSP